MKQEIEQYLKQIEGNLYTCPRKKRTAFLRDLRGNIAAYMEEHPNATLPELKNIFGSPEAIAESFLQSDEFATTKKVLSSKKKNANIFLIAICILVTAILIYGAIYIADFHDFTQGHWEEEPAQEGTHLPDFSTIAEY